MADSNSVQLSIKEAACFVSSHWQDELNTCQSETASPVCNDPNFNEETSLACGTIIHQQLSPNENTGTKIAASFADTFQYFDKPIFTDSMPAQAHKEYSSDARKEAYTSYTIATQMIKDASLSLTDGKPNTLFDPTPILHNYLNGLINGNFGCTGSNANEPEAIYGVTNSGEYSCGRIRDAARALRDQTKTAFSGSQTPLTPLQRSQLYLQFSAASTSMRDHSSEVDYTDSGYLMTDLRAGWQTPLSNTKLFNTIPMGGPSVAISWSHISSDINSFGSNRDKGSLDIGWKQPLFNLPLSENSLNAYLWPSAGIGVSHNELNFGLPQLTSAQWSGTLNTQAILGAELCFNSGVCPSLYGGYAYDRTLWGEPDYDNQGIVAGGAVAFRPFKLKADQK